MRYKTKIDEAGEVVKQAWEFPKEMHDLFVEKDRLEKERVKYLEKTPATLLDIEKATNYLLDYVRQIGHWMDIPDYRIEKNDEN